MAEGFDLTAERTYLGTGWAFPLGVDGRGGIALASGEQAVERSVRLILFTLIGERRMRPEFGCAINELVFAPNNSSTRDRVERLITEALGRWEPRISVTSVDAETDPDDPARLLINISYLIEATNDERNLVHPFYLIAGEEDVR